MTREDRLVELLKEEGQTEDLPVQPYKRYALVEYYDGPSTARPWITTHDSIPSAFEYSADTEEDSGYIADRVIDLDTGEEFTAHKHISYTFTQKEPK